MLAEMPGISAVIQLLLVFTNAHEDRRMLEHYFGNGATEEERKRLLAVQAALEISKAAVSSSTANSGIRSQMDLRNVAQEVASLADAIQDALEESN